MPTKIRLFFAWYDLWVGAYWDSCKRQLYICPIPMVCICIHFKMPQLVSDPWPPVPRDSHALYWMSAAQKDGAK